MNRDCIVTFKKYILDSSLADEDELAQIEKNCDSAIATSVKFADDSPYPSDDALMEDVYTTYKN